MLFKVRNGVLTLEMLEMKIDPAMCMKTQARGQNVHSKNSLLTRKCAHCTIIYNNRSGLLAENAKITRSIGAKADPKSADRPIDPSEEHGVG